MGIPTKEEAFQVEVKGSLILNDALFALEAASDGLGLMYITENVAQEKLASGKLEIVLNEFAATSDGYYLQFRWNQWLRACRWPTMTSAIRILRLPEA